MPDGEAFIQSLPEPMRADPAFKDVKDVGDLATRYATAIKPKAFGDYLTPELKTNPVFKDIKDVPDLAGRYVKATGPRALAEMLPDDIKTEAAFADIKDVGGLAKSYLGATKKLGLKPENVLRIPVDEKDEAGWNEIYQKLGRPEKPDGYKIDPPKDLPKGVSIDTEMQKRFLENAHKAGVSQKAAAALYQWYNGEVVQQFQKNAGVLEKATQERAQKLKTEMGQAYESRLTDAQSGIVYLDKELKLNGELAAALDRTRLGNEPALFKLFDHLTKQLKEDGLIGKTGDGKGGDGAKSPTEALQAIAAKQADKPFMARYINKSAAGHKEAVDEMQALYTAAYPNQEKVA